MAKDDDRPQFNPRHRIAGAIILVSLAVIFLPMLFDESAPPKETQTLTEIPARDAMASETKVVVTPVPAADSNGANTAAAEPMPEKGKLEKSVIESSVPQISPKTAAAVVETKTGPVPAVDKKSETPAKSKPVVAKSSELKIGKGWVVQVGTFTNTGNIDRLRDKLASRGFTVSAEPAMVSGSKAVRLRVGPFRDKSTAAKAQAQLQKELNIQGIVLAHP